MVKFYTSCETLQAVVVSSLYHCIQNSPAIGWIRGDSASIPQDVKTSIEKYMQNHTVSKAEIEALFVEGDGEDAGVFSAEKPSGLLSDTISLAGARTIIEELAKRMPKTVEWGEF